MCVLALHFQQTLLDIFIVSGWFAQGLNCSGQALLLALFIIPNKVRTMTVAERWLQGFARVRTPSLVSKHWLKAHFSSSSGNEKNKRRTGNKGKHSAQHHSRSATKKPLPYINLCPVHFASEVRTRASSFPVTPGWTGGSHSCFRGDPIHQGQFWRP